MKLYKSILIPSMAAALAVSGFDAAAQQALPQTQIENGATAATEKPIQTRAEDGWKHLGTGKYRENLLHEYRLFGDWYPEWDVEVYESEKTPGRYKVVNPYANSPFSGWGAANNNPEYCIFIYAEDPEGVMIPDWYPGFDFTDPENDQVGPFMIWSQAHDYYENQFGDLEKAKEEGLCGKLKNGAITFPPGSLLVQIAPDYETHYEVWKPSNKNGKFRVKLPGAPDLDINFTYEFSTDGTVGTIKTNVAIDKDVQKVAVAIVNSTDAEAIYEAMVAEELDTYTITESGTYSYEITKNGSYTVMMVPYYNNEALEPVYGQGEYIISDAEWTTCSEYGTWSDGFIYGIQDGFIPWYESTGEVEVQYSNTTPGMIRLVDPFGPNSYEMASASNYDTSKKHYMVFHLDDPERVYLDVMSPIGLNIGYGDMDVWCKAMRWRELGNDEAEVEKWFGKLNGNTVTFPTGGLYIKFPLVTPSWYPTNFKDTFKLILPDEVLQWLSGVEEIEAGSLPGEAEYYTLQGLRVKGTALTPGIYVKIADGKASKVVVK